MRHVLYLIFTEAHGHSGPALHRVDSPLRPAPDRPLHARLPHDGMSPFARLMLPPRPDARPGPAGRRAGPAREQDAAL